MFEVRALDGRGGWLGFLRRWAAASAAAALPCAASASTEPGLRGERGLGFRF